MTPTALVTGATDGIGLETARQLLDRGYRVILHGRSSARLDEARAALQGEAVADRLGTLCADLASMSAVAEAGQALARQHPALDVLIHNAGVYETTRTLTVDGFERTMAINHFAPFLLTWQLRPALEAAPQGRVVVVASIAHGSGQLDLEDLTFSRGFTGYGAYAASKLANILFTVELARRLAGTRVTANCLHPGVIGTKLLRKGFGMGGDSVERGARTTVFVATAPELADTRGRYFDDCRPAQPSARATDPALARALWERSEALLERWLAPEASRQ